MANKMADRVKDLERRVRELEARPQVVIHNHQPAPFYGLPQPVQPYVNPNYFPLTLTCGQSAAMDLIGHAAGVVIGWGGRAIPMNG